jgi:hypothetical protein
MLFTQSQCLSFCYHLYYFKQESVTDTKIHTWKFSASSQSTAFQQLILKLTCENEQWAHKHLSTYSYSQKNNQVVEAGEKVILMIKKGEKDLIYCDMLSL